MEPSDAMVLDFLVSTPSDQEVDLKWIVVEASTVGLSAREVSLSVNALVDLKCASFVATTLVVLRRRRGEHEAAAGPFFEATVYGRTLAEGEHAILWGSLRCQCD